MTPALSLTGLVFGMHATAVKPPATADGGAGRHRLLVLLSRLAQVHVHVDQPGHDDQAARHLDDLVAPSTGRSRPTRAMRSPSISRSNTPSRPFAGSTTRPPFSSSLGNGLRNDRYSALGLTRSRDDRETEPSRQLLVTSVPFHASRRTCPQSPRLRRPAGTAPPCGRPRRWRPARESPSTGRRRRRTRSRRRGSSARDA